MTIQDAKEELVLLLTAIRGRTPDEWATYDPLGDAIVLAQAIADERKEVWGRIGTRKWMFHHLDVDGVDPHNATQMAEDAAEAFGMDDEGGPLDDPNHWIWDLAIEICPPE